MNIIEYKDKIIKLLTDFKKILPKKHDWSITIDFMMIISKYFLQNNDFINVMKVNKKFKHLVSMFHFNPIDDPSLFENIQTQHFYSYDGSLVPNRIKNMTNYIFWNTSFTNYKSKKNKDIIKGFIIESFYHPQNVDDQYAEGLLELNYIDVPSEDVKLPSTLKSLGELTFCIYNSNITNVTIPDNLTSIGDNCFAYCHNLTKIKLPIKLQYLGKGSLHDTGITDIIIPEGIVCIKQDTFKFCTKLTNVTFNENLLWIEERGFKQTDLKVIKLNKGIKSLGYESFSYINHVNELEIYNDDISLNEEAFSNTRIDKVKVIFTEEKEKILKFPITASLYLRLEDNNNIIKNDVILTNYDIIEHISLTDIPFFVTKLGEKIFYGRKINYLKLPDSIKEISSYAFSNGRIKKIILSNNLTKLNSYTFSSCIITDILIPEGITKIEKGCFQDCTELTKVILPSTLKEIKSFAFSSCGFKEILLPEGLQLIGSKAFSHCGSLSKVNLPKTLKKVYKDSFEFTDTILRLIGDGNNISTTNPIENSQIEFFKHLIDDNVEYEDPELFGITWKELTQNLNVQLSEEDEEYKKAKDLINSDNIIIALKNLLKVIKKV